MANLDGRQRKFHILAMNSTAPILRSDISKEKTFLARPSDPPVAWINSEGLTPYPDALAFMEARADAIRAGTAGEPDRGTEAEGD